MKTYDFSISWSFKFSITISFGDGLLLFALDGPGGVDGRRQQILVRSSSL